MDAASNRPGGPGQVLLQAELIPSFILKQFLVPEWPGKEYIVAPPLKIHMERSEPKSSLVLKFYNATWKFRRGDSKLLLPIENGVLIYN